MEGSTPHPKEEKVPNLNRVTSVLVNAIGDGDLFRLSPGEALSRICPLTNSPEKAIRVSMNDMIPYISKNTPKHCFLSHSIAGRSIPLSMSPENYQTFHALVQQNVPIISIQSYTFSSIIIIPVRGNDCTHYDVMDLEYLIREIRQKGWNCPLCGKSLRPDTIYIDRRLEAELKQIRERLKEEEYPDWLVYSQAESKFIRANSTTLAKDTHLTKHKVPLSTSSTPLYSFSDLYLSPDKRSLEILFDIIKPTKHAEAKSFRIIPTIIFGDAEKVNEIKTGLAELTLEPVAGYFVTFAPRLYNGGHITKKRIIKLLFRLNQKFRLVILVDRTGSAELKSFVTPMKSSEKKKNDAADADADVDSDVINFEHDSVNVFSPGDIEGIKGLKFIEQPVQKNLFTDISDKFLKSFEGLSVGHKLEAEGRQEEFENMFKDALLVMKPTSSIIGTIRGESGLIFKLQMNPDKYYEGSKSIEISQLIRKEDSPSYGIVSYQIRVPIRAPNEPHTEQPLIYSANTPVEYNETTGEAGVSVIGPATVNAETVVLPMLLSDMVIICEDKNLDNIVKSIIAAKQANPCIMQKLVILYVKQDINNIKKLLLDGAAESPSLISAKPGMLYHIQYNVLVENLRESEINGRIGTPIDELWLKTVLPFCSGSAKPKEGPALPSLTAAIRSRLERMKTKKVTVIKEETTMEHEIFHAYLTDK